MGIDRDVGISGLIFFGFRNKLKNEVFVGKIYILVSSVRFIFDGSWW